MTIVDTDTKPKRIKPTRDTKWSQTVKAKSSITTFKRYSEKDREHDKHRSSIAKNEKKNPNANKVLSSKTNGMANINFHPNEICSINP